MYIKKFIRTKVFVIILFLFVTSIFFHKSLINGEVPFPGDLLISEYSPWKYSSYLGYNPGSYPNKAQYFDTLRQLYPWKTFAIDEVKKSSLPLWNPYNFSGSPLLANSQTGALYPLNILFFIFNYSQAWGLYIFLQPLLCLFFTFLYLRSINLSRKASVIASIAFSFSLFMTVFLEYGNIGHAFIWLPLILYAIERSLTKVTLSFLLIPLGIGFSMLAGHLQISIYVLFFSIVYFLFRSVEQKVKRNRFLFVSALFILGVLVSAVQLLPTFELLLNSARTSHEYSSFISNLLLQPRDLIFLLSPDFFGNPVTRNYLLKDSYPGNAIYIGMAALVLAIYSLFLVRKNKFVMFYGSAVVVIMLLIVRSPFSEFLYSLNLPILSASSPSNALFLLAFSLCALSAFGFDTFYKIKRFHQLFPLIIIGSIFSVVWVSVILFGINISTKNFIYSTVLFGVVVLIFFAALFLKKKYILFSLFPILIFDLLFFFTRFNPFVPKELFYPNTSIVNELKKLEKIDRVYGYGAAHIEPNFETILMIYSVEGYDPLYPRDYGALINSSFEGVIPNKFDSTIRSNAVIAPGFGEEDFTKNKFRERIINLLGVKYILNRDESLSSQSTFPKEKLELLYDKEGWSIYQNNDAMARFSLLNKFETYNSSEEFEERFFSDDFDYKTTLLLNDTPSIDESASGSVKLISYSPNKIEFSTQTDGKMLLFLSDTYFPGWEASINGEKKNIFKANYAFRAVQIPEGQANIVFEYKPFFFFLGLKITIISVIAIFVLIVPFKYGIYEKI